MGIWEYSYVKTTIEIPDELFRKAKAKAALQGRNLKDLVAEGLMAVVDKASPVNRRGPARRKNKSNLLTNEIIRELDDDDHLQHAFGGRYRLSCPPVTISPGNEIPALNNAEMAALLETEGLKQ